MLVEDFWLAMDFVSVLTSNLMIVPFLSDQIKFTLYYLCEAKSYTFSEKHKHSLSGTPLIKTLHVFYECTGVLRGKVVKCLTRYPGVLGSTRIGSSGVFVSVTFGKALQCSLELVQPRKDTNNVSCHRDMIEIFQYLLANGVVPQVRAAWKTALQPTPPPTYKVYKSSSYC